MFSTEQARLRWIIIVHRGMLILAPHSFSLAPLRMIPMDYASFVLTAYPAMFAFRMIHVAQALVDEEAIPVQLVARERTDFAPMQQISEHCSLDDPAALADGEPRTRETGLQLPP